MKTALQLVSKAYRWSGIVGEYDAALLSTDTEAVNGLDALVTLYNRLISDGVFGAITDVLIYADYTANENERVIDTVGGMTLSLPVVVTDVYSGEVRSVQDRSVVLQPGATPKAWLFDADLTTWTDINALAIAGTAPLSGRFEGAVCALLAEQLCSDAGIPVPPKVQRDVSLAYGALRRKRPVVVSVESALLRTLPRGQSTEFAPQVPARDLATEGGAFITVEG